MEKNQALLKLGKLLKTRRQAMDLSLDELAAQTNTTAKHLFSVESGLSHPSAAFLCQLCEVLHLTPADYENFTDY